MSAIEQLEKRLREGLGRRREQTTIDQYCWHLRNFCSITNRTSGWDRKILLSYFDKMIKDGRAGAGISKEFYVLKSIFDILGLSFDMKVTDLPRGRSVRRDQPAVSPEDIRSLITYAKSGGDRSEQFYLALSTIYGLRKTEMAKVTGSSMLKFVLTVQTAKHGRPRAHLIPDAIVPYVSLPDESILYAESSLNYVWNRMCKRAGYETKDHEGWHAVRRTLVTQLVNQGLSELDIINFMRWSSGGRGMIGRYFTPQPFEVDKRVFEKHPFLEVWK